MGSWTYSIIENYCIYKIASKKVWKCVDTKGNKSNIRNKGYTSSKNRPAWCRKINRKLLPRTRCGPFGCNCKFYAGIEASPKAYKLLEDGVKFDKENNK